jgi:hypothetical protein
MKDYAGTHATKRAAAKEGMAVNGSLERSITTQETLD